MKFILRSVIAIIFIISGFVKAVDLKGFTFKLEEYFSPAVFDIPIFESNAIFFAILVVVLELALGFMLLMKIKIKQTLYALIALCVFFGFLTFYSAYFNVVTDCGCFGDALKMTPWQSFNKDIALLVGLLILLFLYKKSNETFEVGFAKLPVLVIFMGFMLFIMYRGIAHEPLIDFRAYAIGTDLKLEKQKIAKDPSIYKNFYSIHNQKTGETKKVNQDDYIAQNYWKDANWKIEEGKTTTEIVKQGYESEVNKFKISDQNGEDLTTQILNEPKVILVYAYKPKEASPEVMDKIQTFLLQDKTAKVYGVTTSQNIFKKIPNYMMDEVASKTIARSNPFVLVLENGKVTEKLSAEDYMQEHKN